MSDSVILSGGESFLTAVLLRLAPSGHSPKLGFLASRKMQNISLSWGMAAGAMSAAGALAFVLPWSPGGLIAVRLAGGVLDEGLYSVPLIITTVAGLVASVACLPPEEPGVR